MATLTPCSSPSLPSDPQKPLLSSLPHRQARQLRWAPSRAAAPGSGLRPGPTQGDPGDSPARPCPSDVLLGMNGCWGRPRAAHLSAELTGRKGGPSPAVIRRQTSRRGGPSPGHLGLACWGGSTLAATAGGWGVDTRESPAGLAT